MRNKEECKSLSDAEMTLEEFGRSYPDASCTVHYKAVRVAVTYGYPVFADYEVVYPSLKNIKRRKRDK